MRVRHTCVVTIRLCTCVGSDPPCAPVPLHIQKVEGETSQRNAHKYFRPLLHSEMPENEAA